jgi:hypothetical protein
MLPGDRPFPFLTGGSLPGLALNAPDILNSTFYYQSKAFAVFIPLNHLVPIDLFTSLKIKNINIGHMGILKDESDTSPLSVPGVYLYFTYANIPKYLIRQMK